MLSDGRVILIGGSNGTAPVATTEIFDPLSNSVSAGAALSVPRMAHSATTLLDGRVLVVGGTTVVTNPDGSTSNTDLASAEIYDPATGGFGASTSSLAAARRDHTAFLLPNNNSVLIVGGTSSGNEIGTAEMFVPSTGTFAPTGSPAAARQRATGTALKQDGILLLAGGSNSTGTLSSAELYGFATVKTDKADYAPGTIVTITGSGWQPGETVTLTLVESPLVDTHPVMTAVADSTGKIVNTDFSPDEYDISIRFYLTAVGSISGIQAQNTFTDGNATVSGKVTSSATGNPIQGATVACDITSGCNASSSTTTLADGTYSFKPSFAGNGPAIFSVTASATGFNPGSSSPISVPTGGNGMTFGWSEYRAHSKRERDYDDSRFVAQSVDLRRFHYLHCYGTPVEVAPTSAFSVDTGTCSPVMTVQVRMPQAPAQTLSQTYQSAWAAAPAVSLFHNSTDTTCSLAPITGVTIPTSGNTASFRYKDSNGGSPLSLHRPNSRPSPQPLRRKRSSPFMPRRLRSTATRLSGRYTPTTCTDDGTVSIKDRRDTPGGNVTSPAAPRALYHGHSEWQRWNSDRFLRGVDSVCEW